VRKAGGLHTAAQTTVSMTGERLM